jgi:hypothetical protein
MSIHAASIIMTSMMNKKKNKPGKSNTKPAGKKQEKKMACSPAPDIKDKIVPGNRTCYNEK